MYTAHYIFAPTSIETIQIVGICYSIDIMSCNSLTLFAVLLSFLVVYVDSHGYIYDPPSRSSVWRIFKDQAPINYNDNAIYCGGFGVCNAYIILNSIMYNFIYLCLLVYFRFNTI